MNLFESCYVILLVLVFAVVLAWVAGLHGWLQGVGAACSVTLAIVLVTVLVSRRSGKGA